MEETRKPLTRSDRRCTRTLKPGEVKRVQPLGPVFVGYYIACPGCGFVAAYINDDHADRPGCGFVERPSGEHRVPPELVGITRPPTCLSCKATITIEGGDIVARRS